MSSEAITRNDLSAILNEVLPPTPSEYKKLLWANPSPTSAFSAQTVSLDLSNYDDVEVEFMCWNTEQQEMASVTVAIGASGRMVSPLAVCAFRKFSVTSTSVAFENAQAYPNYGNWALGTQNNACIPYRIYGIKYERVAPPQVDASDYVVEQGTSGIWIYRKWNSGIAECWGIWSGSLTHYATALGGYAYYVSINYPTSLFIAPPIHSYSAYVGGGFALTGTVTSAYADKVVPYAVSNVSGTNTVYFYITSVGRWK